MWENIESMNAKIIHRSQAKNHKSPHETFTEEQTARQHIMSEQIKHGEACSLCNSDAGKKGFIEDNMNAEKNRGYQYKHSYSYNWNAIQCFHLLIRMACYQCAIGVHAQTKKTFKREWILAMLTYIKDTIFNPWLSDK